MYAGLAGATRIWTGIVINWEFLQNIFEPYLWGY